MTFPISITCHVDSSEEPRTRTIQLFEGITVVLGPNGSGKTQLLRGLKHALPQQAGGKGVRYLSAGRAWHLEQYRSDFDGHRGNKPRFDNAEHGSLDDANRRLKYETLQGDFQTLAARPDILVKVRERLRKLFGRDLMILWDGGQLKIDFLKTTGNGKKYSSAREASGLLHLVGLLAAAYDDDVGVLIIDEPEVSLHPQLQSFLLKELQSVAGLPEAGSNKKLIIIATHSTEFVRVDSPADLSSLVFCYSPDTQPVQVDPGAGELQNKKLLGLIARMGQEHKLCFFAKHPLLIEGPSDAIICSALSRRLDITLEASGAQILPVIGKGQFGVVNKLFRLLGKSPLTLADADGLADGVELANDFLQSPSATEAATKMGAASGTELSGAVYAKFCQLVDSRWPEIQALAEQHWYWVNRETADATNIKSKRRAAFSTLFCRSNTEIEALAVDKVWLNIKTRFAALMDLLENEGLYILRRGTIESYYTSITAGTAEKPSQAAEEAATIMTAVPARIADAYGDVVRFLRRAATTQSISEWETLQDYLLAAAAPALARVRDGVSQEALASLMTGTLGKQAELFKLNIKDSQLEISLASKILDVSGFPMLLNPDEDLLKTIRKALDSKAGC